MVCALTYQRHCKAFQGGGGRGKKAGRGKGKGRGRGQQQQQQQQKRSREDMDGDVDMKHRGNRGGKRYQQRQRRAMGVDDVEMQDVEVSMQVLLHTAVSFRHLLSATYSLPGGGLAF